MSYWRQRCGKKGLRATDCVSDDTSASVNREKGAWIREYIGTENGGGGGIRTLVTLYRPNGFQDRRIQPLCHPSAWGKNKAGTKACFGINWRRVRDLNPGDAFDAYTISNRAPSATRTTLR